MHSEESKARRRECCREYGKKRCKEDPTFREKNRLKAKRWREANPERAKALYRKNYTANIEERRAGSRRWYAEHKEYSKEYRREYLKTHLVAHRIADHRRRARENHAEGFHTAEEWQNVLIQHNNKCFYCGTDKEFLTQDHAIPLSRGGSDWIENIVPACKSCNSQKQAKTSEEYIQWLRHT